MGLQTPGDAGTGSRAAKGGSKKRGNGSNVTELAAAATKGDLTAAAALSRIVKTHQALIKAEEAHEKVMTKTREAQEETEGAFRNEMDLGQEAASSDEQILKRLQSVERKWEAYNASVADAKTKRDKSKTLVKTATKAFERAMDSGKQPELFPDID